jgi:hypothetical protein
MVCRYPAYFATTNLERSEMDAQYSSKKNLNTGGGPAATGLF